MIGTYIGGWGALLIARFSDTPKSRRRLRDAALNAQIFEAEKLSERLEARAAEMTARSVEELNEEGLDYYDEGEYTAAAKSFRKSVAEDPTDYQALRGLALSIHQLDEYSEATYYYYSALSAAPDDVEMLTNLGFALAGANREQEALDVLTRAAEIAPDDPTVLKALAQALDYLGQAEQAATLAQRALSVDQEDPEAHALLGSLYWYQGLTDEALESWERSLEIDPANPDVNLALAELFDETLEFEMALTYASAALEIFTDQDNVQGQVQSLVDMAWVLYRLGRHEEAEAKNQRVLSLDPELAQVWFNMGLNRLVAGDVSGATEAYDQALEVTGLADLKRHGIKDLEALTKEDQREEVTVLLARLRQEYSDRRRNVATAS